MKDETQSPAPASAPEPDPDPQAAEPAPAPESDAAPAGSEPNWVKDFGSPEANARFRYIYRNMRESERALREMAEINKTLSTRLAEMESHQIDRDRSGEMAMLQGQLHSAKEAGNTAAESAITARIATLAAQPKPEARAVPEVNVPSMALSMLNDWKFETDAAGNFVRPWAHNGHPRFQEAYQAVAAARQQYGEDVVSILRAADERMGMKKSPVRNGANASGSAVLSGTGVRPASSGNATLTPEQRRVAERLGLDPERYLKQLRMIEKNEPAVAASFTKRKSA